MDGRDTVFASLSLSLSFFSASSLPSVLFSHLSHPVFPSSRVFLNLRLHSYLSLPFAFSIFSPPFLFSLFSVWLLSLSVTSVCLVRCQSQSFFSSNCLSRIAIFHSHLPSYFLICLPCSCPLFFPPSHPLYISLYISLPLSISHLICHFLSPYSLGQVPCRCWLSII